MGLPHTNNSNRGSKKKGWRFKNRKPLGTSSQKWFEPRFERSSKQKNAVQNKRKISVSRGTSSKKWFEHNDRDDDAATDQPTDSPRRAGGRARERAGKRAGGPPGRRAGGQAGGRAHERASEHAGARAGGRATARARGRAGGFAFAFVFAFVLLSLSLSLSLSCSRSLSFWQRGRIWLILLSGRSALVKTNYRRNCTVFPTIVFTNLVLGYVICR